jgi:hypothetical protein
VSAIWAADASGQWGPLAPAGFAAEAGLHDLVEKAPQMLPLAGSPQLTVLAGRYGWAAAMPTCLPWSHRAAW